MYGESETPSTSGTRERSSRYHLKDGRWYYTAAAESPQEAYDQAVLDFESACVGEAEITDWFLEHVSDETADNYWYREDLLKGQGSMQVCFLFCRKNRSKVAKKTKTKTNA